METLVRNKKNSKGLHTLIYIFYIALGEDMYADGYKHITNIDYSKTVIENMKARCADKPEMECKQTLHNDQSRTLVYNY